MRAVPEKLRVDAVESFRCIEWEADRPPAGCNFHLHPECELVLTTQDHGRRFVGDHIGNYADWDLVLLAGRLPHGWASAVPDRDYRRRIVVVHFTRDCLGAGLFAIPEMRPVARLLNRAGRGLQVLGRTRADVAEWMREMPAARGPRRVALLLQVLERLAGSRELRPLSSPQFAPVLREEDDQRIDLVCGHIAEHAAARLSLAETAAKIHLSPSAFSRFFKRCTGTTFVAYVNALRVGRACQLLSVTDKNITAVCLESGFRNLAHFNRVFRSARKMAPRQYRQTLSRTFVANQRPERRPPRLRINLNRR